MAERTLGKLSAKRPQRCQALNLMCSGQTGGFCGSTLQLCVSPLLAVPLPYVIPPGSRSICKNNLMLNVLDCSPKLEETRRLLKQSVRLKHIFHMHRVKVKITSPSKDMKHSTRLSNGYVIHEELTQQSFLEFYLKWSGCEFLWCKKARLTALISNSQWQPMISSK